jgi:glycosyltransferase involved in cell wall biosynthesis
VDTGNSTAAPPQHATPVRSTRPGFTPDPFPAVSSPPAMPGTAFDLAPPSREALFQAIAEAFDAEHYLDRNSDVRAAGVDPLQHYAVTGAFEGRDPNRWFDSRAYILANPDVDAMALNPLWHYLVQGRAQARPPRRMHAAERAAQGQARSLAADHPPAQPFACLMPETFRSALEARLASAVGVTLAVSHDRYTHSVGGVQILVSDEQLAFNARGEAYLHIAPRTPRLSLAPADEAPFYLHATLDGAYVGTTTYADLAAVLAALRPRLPARRRLVLHCLLGHQAGAMALLHAAMQPQSALFWVNDYESICPGYNLLRNDVEFCGAPPVGSFACRVCVHGPHRAAHVRQFEALFDAVPLHVVAPSVAALAVWQAGARLPHLSVVVHEYAAVTPVPAPAAEPPAALDAVAGAGPVPAAPVLPAPVPIVPVRVAYVGYAAAHKGWPTFSALAARLQGSAEYRLFHFAASPAEPPLPGVETVLARVTPGARGAMTESLLAHGIHLVLAASPWPETFCLVAYEALAAGADLVVLQEGGNLPDLVLRTGRGVVAADAEAVLDFFLHGAAARYAALAAAGRQSRGRLASRGMTATLPLPGASA